MRTAVFSAAINSFDVFQVRRLFDRKATLEMAVPVSPKTKHVPTKHKVTSHGGLWNILDDIGLSARDEASADRPN